MTIEISASQMLSARGWLHDAKVSIDAEGYVVDIAPNDGTGYWLATCCSRKAVVVCFRRTRILTPGKG